MNINYDKFWEERIEETRKTLETIQEGEMTIKMFSERTKKAYRSSRELLELWVKKGILGKRFAILDGNRTAIYFPLEKPS